MPLDAQGVRDAGTAGLREAVIAVFRQIEMKHPGILDAAIGDINAVFGSIPAPEDRHAEARTIIRNEAVKVLEGAKP